MAKNWKHTKKLLEDLLCDKLKGRIAYQLHCYRPDDNWTVCFEILLDKEPIFKAGSCPPKNPNYNIDIPGADIRRILTKYLKTNPSDVPVEINSTSIRTAADFVITYFYGCQRQESGLIYLEDAMSMLGDYLSSDIEVSLKSTSPFINALAVLDRRVGKRRLLKIAEQDSSFAPKWAWPFYQARFEAERIVSPSWLKNPYL